MSIWVNISIFSPAIWLQQLSWMFRLTMSSGIYMFRISHILWVQMKDVGTLWRSIYTEFGSLSAKHTGLACGVIFWTFENDACSPRLGVMFPGTPRAKVGDSAFQYFHDHRECYGILCSRQHDCWEVGQMRAQISNQENYIGSCAQNKKTLNLSKDAGTHRFHQCQAHVMEQDRVRTQWHSPNRVYQIDTSVELVESNFPHHSVD